MDVTRKHRRDVCGEVTAADHVGGAVEHEVSAGVAHDRAFDAVMEAEQTHVGRVFGQAHLSEQGREPVTDLGDMSKTTDREPHAGHLHVFGARCGEHDDAGVHREEWVGHRRALVIAGDDEHRAAGVGDASKRREGILDDPRRHPGMVEHVAAVDHDVYLATERGRERLVIAGQEVIAPAPTANAGAPDGVEAEVGVRDEEDAHTEHMHSIRRRDSPHLILIRATLDRPMKLDKDVFVALAAIVWCDGEVSEKEAQALLRAASAWGIVGDEYAEIERCTRTRVPLEIVSQLNLAQDTRLLVYALGAWLTKVDGVVVPTEGAILDQLAASLNLTEEERAMAQSDGMLVAAFQGGGTRRDVIAVAREIEERATMAFDQTMRLKRP